MTIGADLGNRSRTDLPSIAPMLEWFVVAFLFLFVLAQPLSIAGAEIAYSGAVLCWVLRFVLVRRAALPRSPLDGPILVYWLLCAVSAALSPLPASSWEGMRKISLILLVLVVAHNVWTAKRARQLLALLFLSGLASVTYAAWQYVAGIGLRVVACEPAGLAYRAGIRVGTILFTADGRRLRVPEDLLTVARAKASGEAIRLGVVPGGEVAVRKDAVTVILPLGEIPAASRFDTMGMTLARERPRRAHAFYSEYISYADEMQMLLALAFGLWLGSRYPFRFPGLGFAALTLIFAIALGGTLTRSAWLAAVVACLVELWFHTRLLWVRVLLPLVLMLAAFATDAAMKSWRGVGLVDLKDAGTAYRLLMWRDGLRLIREHPWFGVGMNTIRDAWPQFNLMAYRIYPLRSHFHSTPIQLAVEMGLPVLLAWIVLMAAYWRMLAKLVVQARKKPDGLVYGLSLGMIGATTGFLFNSLVQYNFGDSVVVLLFWFLMGLALALHHGLATGRAINPGAARATQADSQ